MSKNFYLIPMTVLVFISMSQNVYAKQWVTEMDDVYKNLNFKTQSNPDAVLSYLKANIPSDKEDENILAQHHLLLSSVYNTLIYSELAISHAKTGLKYVTFEKEPWLFHKLQLALSISFDSAGQPNKGLSTSISALKWAESTHDLELTIDAQIVYGYLLISLGEYISALDTLHQSYQLANQSNNTAPAEIAGIIALVYEYRKEDDLSIPYYQQAADYHRAKNNWVELSIALYGLGRAHGITGKNDLAFKELQESADVSVEINDKQGAAYAWKELAGLEMKNENFSKAQELIEKSLVEFKNSNNHLMQFDIHIILSRLAIKQNNPKMAEYYTEEAIKFIDEKRQPLQYISLLKQVSNVMAHKQEYEKAYNKLWNVMLKEKKHLSKQSTQQLHKLRTKYELEAKDQQNQILTKNNEINEIKIILQARNNKNLKYKLFFLILVSVVLLIYAYWFRKNKNYFEKLANIDSLTGVYTRSKSLELLTALFDQNKTKRTNFAIAMFDLDLFKNINDIFGHQQGDKVLKEVGLICSSLLPKESITGRFGGEEFIVCFSNLADNKVKELLEKLRIDIASLSIKLNIDNLNVSISTGVCFYDKTKQLSFNTIDDMIKIADDLLYIAKEKGRNQIKYSL